MNGLQPTGKENALVGFFDDSSARKDAKIS
jgi:hypothetical protein